MNHRLLILAGALAAFGWAQDPVPEPGQKSASSAETKPADRHFDVAEGTRIPLSMINSVSTKNAAEGDRVYLETIFPILVNGRIVIPPGSYVAGTITQVKRAGKVKGRAELYLRFDSLTLPNGVTRDFRGRIGALDGRAGEDLDREEGKIRSEGDKSGDARTVAETTMAGTSIGALAGIGRNAGMGAGIGAAAGATAGLMTVLLSRGPDAVLARGTTLEMTLDRTLKFDESELDFNTSYRRTGPSSLDATGPQSQKNNRSVLGGTRGPGIR
jgi:type IV secretion system protein VirB10